MVPCSLDSHLGQAWGCLVLRVGQEYGGGADQARLTSQELRDLGADMPRRPCPGWLLSSLTCTPLLRAASSSRLRHALCPHLSTNFWNTSPRRF